MLRFKPVVVSWLLRFSAFYGWLSWHWNEWYFIALFFFGVENIVVTFSPSLFLLWCWAFSGRIHRRSLLSFDVASSMKTTSSLPALLGYLFSEVNLCSVILWRWGFCDEFYSSAFFFFGIENPAPEITAVPCTSLVLASSATNSTKSAYSSATSWQA